MKLLIKKPALNFCLLLLLSFFLVYITAQKILTVSFFQDNGDILSGIPGQAAGIYSSLQKWLYLSSAIYLLLKIGVTTLIIQTALYLNDEELPVENIISCCINAEFIFLIPAAVKIFTFRWVYPDGSLLDWHKYYVLSALSLFEQVAADWYYALQSLNLFEIAYWFILAYGISQHTKLSYDRSVRLIFLSYVPSLLIWVIAVTFFTLVMFPAVR